MSKARERAISAGVFAAVIVSRAMFALAESTTLPSNLIRTSSSPSGPPTSNSLDLSRVLGALLLVLAAIWVLKWAAKRLMKPVSGSNEVIKVLSRTMISPKQHVLAMLVGERVLIVADNGQQLTTLCEIRDLVEVEGFLGKRTHRDKDTLSRRERERGAEVVASGSSRELTSTHSEVRGLLEKVRVLSQQFK